MDKIPVDRTGAERLTLGTDELTVIARGADTGGGLFAVEIRMPPGGGPPVMHRHAPGEIYYVQEGEFAFYVGHPQESVRRITASAGEIVPLTGGTPHTIRNETDADARAFVVHAPGAVMESFSYAAADLAANGKADMAAVLELASRSGIDLLGPVPEKFTDYLAGPLESWDPSDAERVRSDRLSSKVHSLDTACHSD